MADSEDYFSQLSAHVGPERVAEWTADEERMQASRNEKVNVMDEMDVRECAGEMIAVSYSINYFDYNDSS